LVIIGKEEVGGSSPLDSSTNAHEFYGSWVSFFFVLEKWIIIIVGIIVGMTYFQRFQRSWSSREGKNPAL